jgi:phosphatidylserine/phosphatidylglycerophosphate/cardiolipin synthase-like enzyme
MERKETNFWKSILISGLGFGVGGVIGNFALYLLIRSELLNWPLDLIPEGQSFVLLLTAIVVIILGVGLTTGIGGAIGGYVLSIIDPIYARRKYIWRTAIATGLTEALLIIPLILFTAILALYNNGLERDPTGQVLVFGIYGVIFGIIIGLILGFSTVGWRQAWRILLASIAGFGLGGAAVGYGIRTAYYPASLGEPLPNFTILLPILTFVFFGIGGLFIGWVYEWVTHWRMDNVPDEPARWVKVAGVIAALLIAFFLISNYRQLVKFLTINPGSLSSQIEIDTTGVHWKKDEVISHQLTSNDGTAYSASASVNGEAAAVWMGDHDGISAIFLSNRAELDSGENRWGDPLQISINSDFNAIHPEVSTDENRRNHIVWTELHDDSSTILYRSCEGEICGEPAELSSQIGPSCKGIDAADISPTHDWPVISVADDNSIMVVWSNSDNILFYSTWETDQAPPVSPTGCHDGPKISASALNQFQPRLSGGQDGSFSIVFSVLETGSETVYQMDYIGQQWNFPQSLGSGKTPNIFTLPKGGTYYAWCDSDSQVRIKNPETDLVDLIDFPPCNSRPTMSLAENDALHLVWYSNEIKNNQNVVSKANIIYESIQTEQGWSEPAIVVETDDYSLPVIAGMGGGDLNILWSDNAGQRLNSAQQPIYECSGDELGEIGQVMIDVIENGSYRSEGDPIPYCKNSYLGLIYMPNPESVYSPQPPDQNGGFSTVSNIASLVEYEVLLSVMEWAADENDQGLNPGSVYTIEIAKLYQQINEDPSRYPRGLTIRILLGNYPELSELEWGEQIWNVIDDLRNAGVDKMVDSDIGWNVEIANYEGVYPHSHTKFLVVDGKIAVGAGFNYGYLHFPFDHPSNKGGDLFDLGIVISGPIAQQALVTFDDYWQGAEQLYCPDLSSNPEYLWNRDCVRSEAQASHVPEVRKYFLPETQGELSNAFSLTRNIEFKESDDVIRTVLSSAQESLDIWEVNFSLELICMLDLFNDKVCSFDNALDFMDAIITSVEQNQTKVRVLVEKINSNGMENRVAAKEFTRELEERGLSQYVEIRFFEGRMHSKAFLVDDEILFIGSQNFHYSAWGERGLAEYNLATDDPRAVSTFKTMFDYYWETGIPWEEYQ